MVEHAIIVLWISGKQQENAIYVDKKLIQFCKLIYNIMAISAIKFYQLQKWLKRK